MTGSRQVEGLGMRCVATLRDGVEQQAVDAFARLLDEPHADVVRWLASAVLAAAAGVPDTELVDLVGPSISRPEIVSETVAALRTQDAGRLLAATGPDPVDLVVHLAAVVATLDAWAG